MQVVTYVVAAEPNLKVKNYIRKKLFFCEIQTSDIAVCLFSNHVYFNFNIFNHCTYSVNEKRKIILLPPTEESDYADCYKYLKIEDRVLVNGHKETEP